MNLSTPPKGDWSARLADVQHRRAGSVVLLAVLLAAACLPLIAQLGLNSSFTALLPENKPSVRDLRQVESRMGGLNTLSLAIQSTDAAAMRRFATDLVPRLKALEGQHGLRSVEWNVGAYEDFVSQNAGLYADRADLVKARDALAERLDYERARNNPLYFSLDDEEPPDPQQALDELQAKAREGKEKFSRYPGGFYLHPDGDLLAIFLRTDIRGGDVVAAQALMDRVTSETEALGMSGYAADLRLEFAGDLLHAREETDAIARELLVATSLTVALVLLAIWLFFRRKRVPLLLGLSLGVPTLVTFACAELLVDYLNTSTAFLGSIVVGNGINPNVIWLARHFEERRRGEEGSTAIAKTHRGTWLATLTASTAAAVAYASLTITDFRGFRDFGIIGGLGMMVCWASAHLLLPSATALLDRVKPLRLADSSRAGGRRLLGALLAQGVISRPKILSLGFGVLGAVALLLLGQAVYRDPIEYDFRNLRSVREQSSRASVLNSRTNQIVGGSGTGQAIAIVTPAVEDARRIESELEERRERDPAGTPFGKVRSLDDLLPRDQDEKLALLGEIRQLMQKVRPHANDATRRRIDEHLPREDLRVLTLNDLPDATARNLSERDGTRGRLLLVEQRPGESLWDGRYLVRWAQALRSITLADGQRPPLAGRGPVFADMIEVVWTDGPLAVLASLAATVLLLGFAFRRMRERLLSLMALLLGIVLMGGAMAAFGMKLNFLNFVAFPITFGNGVDYGVNVLRRRAEELAAGRGAREALRRAIEETGGAVGLCSLTTIIGYSSLYASANRALNSFGAAMAISEVTCVVAAVVAMPAAAVWLDSRRREPAAASGG